MCWSERGSAGLGGGELRYDDWERGCASDYVRNGFLVPNIVEFLDQTRPDSILDVGSLTGYMARTIAGQLTYSPHWTLLDRDVGAIEYSKTKMPASMNVQFVGSDLETWDSNEQFGAALLTFTLLELEDRKSLLGKIAPRVRRRGHLIVALPDCLEDVIAKAEIDSNFGVLHEFVGSDMALPKIDKFTGQPYPFCASRLSRVISDTIEAGFSLLALKRDTSKGEGVFIMRFQRADLRA
jgi:SAM-dependent methyltransferase